MWESTGGAEGAEEKEGEAKDSGPRKVGMGGGRGDVVAGREVFAAIMKFLGRGEE